MKERSLDFTGVENSQVRPRGHVRITIATSPSTVLGTDKVITCERYHYVDPISRELPIEQFTATVIDLTGAIASVPKGTAVQVEFGLTVNGAVEYLSPDTYYLADKPTYKDGKTSIEATSKLMQMNDTVVGSTLGTHETQASALQKLFAEGDASIVLTGNTLSSGCNCKGIANEPLKNCIQQVLHAGGRCMMSNGHNVTIKTVLPQSPVWVWSYPLRDVLANGFKTVQQTNFYATNTKIYSYGNATEQTLFEQTLNVVANKPIKCEFNTVVGQPEMVTIGVEYNTGGGTFTTLSGLYGTTLTFSQNANVTITITGLVSECEESSITSIWGNDARGSTDTESNPVITNKYDASTLAVQTANWLAIKTGYILETRGHPELEPTDIISIHKEDGTHPTCYVVGVALKYDGAFSGQLELLDINNVRCFLPAPEITLDILYEGHTVCSGSVPESTTGHRFMVYMDGINVVNIDPNLTFNIRDYCHDADNHTVYFVAYKQGFTISEPSNVLTMNTDLPRIATPNIGLQNDAQGRPMIVIFNSSQIGAYDRGIFVDGVQRRQIPDGTYLVEDLRLDPGTYQITVKGLATIGDEEADSLFSNALTVTVS